MGAVIHGHTVGGWTPEYRTWSNMRRRCHDPANPGYYKYGARGIFVCNRWRNSFENFLADMGLKPSPKHSIERNNNDGPYSPENCRWATAREQSANTRQSRFLELDGKRLTCVQWARETGLSKMLIYHRLRLGWSIEKTLRTRPNSKITGRPKNVSATAA